MIMHIASGPRTMCGKSAGALAAIDYAAYGYARGPYCPACEHATRVMFAVDEVRWAVEDAAAPDVIGYLLVERAS